MTELILVSTSDRESSSSAQDLLFLLFLGLGRDFFAPFIVIGLEHRFHMGNGEERNDRVPPEISAQSMHERLDVAVSHPRRHLFFFRSVGEKFDDRAARLSSRGLHRMNAGIALGHRIPCR